MVTSGDVARVAGVSQADTDGPCAVERAEGGEDDIAMAAWAAFDLTTVRRPIPEMSRLAAELLLARIADPGRPLVRHRLPEQLVVRGAMAHAPFASDLAAVGAAADPPGGLR